MCVGEELLRKLFAVHISPFRSSLGSLWGGNTTTAARRSPSIGSSWCPKGAKWRRRRVRRSILKNRVSEGTKVGGGVFGTLCRTIVQTINSVLYYITHHINTPMVRSNLFVVVNATIQSLRLELNHNGRRVHVPSRSTGRHSTPCSTCTRSTKWFTERILEGSGWETRRRPPAVGSRL